MYAQKPPIFVFELGSFKYRNYNDSNINMMGIIQLSPFMHSQGGISMKISVQLD